MLKHSKDWIPYTLSKEFAEKFKVKDNTPIHMIKNERYKQYLKIHGSWKRFYKHVKWTWYYVLPPSQWFIAGSEKKYIGLYSDSLYDRQKETVDFVLDMYNQKKKSCFIVSWTGTGKWHIVPSILNSFDDRKILLLAPNNVVALRLMDDLKDIAVYSRGKKILKELDNRVVVTLYKTFNLYTEELNKEFEIVLIDEGHHMWWQLEQSLYTWKGFICWMSATPYRNDHDKDGFEMFFGKMLDTNKQALPVEVYEHKFKHTYDIDAVVEAQKWLAPTSPEIYRRLIIGNNSRYEELELMIANMQDRKWLRNFIIFSDRIEHITKIEEYLVNAFPMSTVVVIKWESDQMSIMEEMKDKHDIIIIWSTSVVKEWMNIPQLEAWILFTSASFMWWIDQMAWRVRRYYWEKKAGYFIDMQDYISVAGSKFKSPWVYARRKAYKQFWWKIGNFVTDFIN